MKLNKSARANINYLAKVVEINSFTPHSNPSYTRIKAAHVDGFTILVGIGEETGKYVYFPTSCCINKALLSYANLYRDSALNADTTKSGMFEENGRVKAIRLGGQVSEGFLLPLQILLNFIIDGTNVNITEDDCPTGTEFDEVEHHGKSFWINKKYVVRVQSGGNGQPSSSDKRLKGRQKRLLKFDRMIENQFKFHYDTVLYRKEPYFIAPDDIISITHKWHGTSAIFANILCKHPLTWKEKIAHYLTGEEFARYEYVCASRSVIKNSHINLSKSQGYYNDNGDTWLKASEVINPYLAKGMTIYAEIVGYNPMGRLIQANYDYGCEPPKAGEAWTCGKHYKIAIYRITMTNVDGVVHEFSAREVQIWCKERGLFPVIECYYGPAKNLYPQLDEKAENWCEQFIEALSNDGNFYMEKNSPDCDNKVPHEGLVIKKEDMMPHAVKLKAFKFIDRESKALDNGEENIEDIS